VGKRIIEYLSFSFPFYFICQASGGGGGGHIATGTRSGGEPFDATSIVEEETEAKQEAERCLLELGRIANGVGSHWVGIHLEERPDMEGAQGPHGIEQEAFDEECAAIARTETVARRRKRLDHLTIFRGAQAAI